MDRRRYRTQHPGIMYRLDAHETRTYIVGFTDSHGKYRTVHMPKGATLKDALAHQGKLNMRKAAGDIVLRSPKKMSELLDEWLESRRPSLSSLTVVSYRWGVDILKEEIGHIKVQELAASHIAQMRQDLTGRGLKKWSIDKIETPLRNALTLAARDGLIPVSPYTKLLPHERVKPDQKEKRCLSVSEIEKLLKTNSSLRWNVCFRTLIFTGLRISEALLLTWEDIDFSSSTLTVTRGKTTASRREVMLIPALAARLKAWKLMQPPGSTYVFQSSENGPPSRQEALNRLKAACRRAGIPEYSLHELRHTFASILIDQGEQAPLIAKQMGHANPQITYSTYAHLFEAQDRVDRARERLQKAYGGLV